MEDLTAGDEVAVICGHGFVVFNLNVTHGQAASTSPVAGHADRGSGYTSERTFNGLDLLGTPMHVRRIWPRSEVIGGTFSASECGCALALPATGDQERLETLKRKRT